VVVPVYDEAENLPELAAQVEAALRATGRSFELICCDDGSRERLRSRAGRPGRDAALAAPGSTWRAITASRARCRPASTSRAAATWSRWTPTCRTTRPDIPVLLARLDEDPQVDVVSGWRPRAPGRRADAPPAERAGQPPDLGG
jgi:hypothetical protein